MPLPHVGAIYGLSNEIDEVIEPLHLFFGGESEELEQLFIVENWNNWKSTGESSVKP